MNFTITDTIQSTENKSIDPSPTPAPINIPAGVNVFFKTSHTFICTQCGDPLFTHEIRENKAYCLVDPKRWKDNLMKTVRTLNY